MALRSIGETTIVDTYTAESSIRIDIDPDWSGYGTAATGNVLDSLYVQNSLSVPFFDISRGISESSRASYSSVSLLGRLEDIMIYTGATNRTVPLQFHFQVQGTQFTDIEDACMHEVIAPVRWLDALKYSVTSDTGINYNPTTVILFIGQLLTMRALLTTCNITWEAPFTPDKMYPTSATVECVFSSSSLNPKQYAGTATGNGSLRFRSSSIVDPGITVVSPDTTIPVDFRGLA
jgi:hypothetical protein